LIHKNGLRYSVFFRTRCNPISPLRRRIYGQDRKITIKKDWPGWYQAAISAGMGLGGGADYGFLPLILSISGHKRAGSPRTRRIRLVCAAAFHREKTGLNGKMTTLLRSEKPCAPPPGRWDFPTLRVIPTIGVGAALHGYRGPGLGRQCTIRWPWTGVLSALVSAIDCVIGGWVADKFGRMVVFFCRAHCWRW